jgi:hypothetical protein
VKSAIAVILLIAFLCLAIAQTEDELWLGVWLLLMIFVALPLLLLVARDLLAAATSRQRRGPLLLHTCAVFAALLGYGVGWMAVDSEHPKAELHQWLVVVFPLFVYVTPLLMLLHGLPVSRLKYFYLGRDEGDG